MIKFNLILFFGFATFLSCKSRQQNSNLNAPVPKFKEISRADFLAAIAGEYTFDSGTEDLSKFSPFCKYNKFEILVSDDSAAEKSAMREFRNTWGTMKPEDKAAAILKEKEVLYFALRNGPNDEDLDVTNYFGNEGYFNWLDEESGRELSRRYMLPRSGKIFDKMSWKKAAGEGSAMELDFSEKGKLSCRSYKFNTEAKLSDEEAKTATEPEFKKHDEVVRIYIRQK